MNQTQACPSEDEVLQFLSGKLSREHVRRLEHHAACCCDCQDLIPGVVELVPPPPSATSEHDQPSPDALRFGPFRVLAVLGRGGMGVVYRAVDERTGEEVAVKTVRPFRRGAVLSLRREIHALSRIRHPGVVRIIAQGGCEGGAGGSEELGWYAMQLVEGQTLAARLAAVREAKRRGSHPAASERTELLEILRRLCSTLSVLHAAGFVHRDLSPRNVIIRPDATPVLVDFGFALADAGDGREVLQLETEQAGTLLYMSPEQILGEACDARSDLYSFGCVLYEVLTGQPPCLGRDSEEIVHAHLSVAPRPPSERAADVSPEMDQLVLWLLAKQARQRPAFADEVGRALSGLGVPGAGSTPVPTPTTPGYLYRSSVVGRQAPLAQLDELLACCERGRGSRVFISGESGAGKTRLAAELASRAQRLGLRVVVGTSAVGAGAQARMAAPALQPLRPLLRAVAECCQMNGKQQTLRLLGPFGRLLASYEPALQRVPGLGELPKLPPLTGEAGRFRLFQALEHTLLAFATTQPFVLVLDDLQWADELTLAFVCEHLGDDFMARHGILLAATCREEEMPPELVRCLDESAALHLALPPLDAGAVDQMIAEMLGTEWAPQRLTAAVASHACGNPLFVVEYLRTAMSEQRLVRSEACWRMRSDPTVAEPLPSTPLPVRQLVLRRLARLSPRAQSLADLAAVLGREFEVEQLLAMAPEHSGESMDALAELVVNQVLEPADGRQYRFVHDKLHEIAYDRIPLLLRGSHHRLVASIIEGRRGQDADFGRHYAALAAHHAAGGDDRRAVIYLQRATSRALRAGTAREAQRLCTFALELGSSGSFSLGTARRARLHRLRAEAHFAVADLPACRVDSLSVLTEVCGRAPGSRGQWWRLLLVQGTRQLLHRLLPVRRFRRRARSRLSRVEGAVAAGLLASVYYFTGDWLAMTASLVLGANLAERAGAPAEIIGSFARLGYVTGLAGLNRLAASFFASATRMARSRGDVPALALTLYLRAFHDLGQGCFAAAEKTGKEAVALLEQVGDVQNGDIARTIVGHALFFQGRVEEASDCYAKLFESAVRRANQQHIGWALTLRARSLMMLGLASEAVPLLEAARQVLAPLADRLSVVMCEGLLASAYLATGRLAQAEEVAAVLTPRLHGTVLPLAPCLHGYLGAAAVALASWDAAASDPARRRAARTAGRRVYRFARMFPMARPAAHLMRAAVAEREGRDRQAARWYRIAVQEARALGMSPYAVDKVPL